jgi:hypothetical protein
MSGLLASGQLIDWIILAMVLEGAGLAGLHAWTGRGVAPRDFVANLASGMCLLLAMRLILGDAWWGFAAAALLAALFCHVLELARNWR